MRQAAHSTGDGRTIWGPPHAVLRCAASGPFLLCCCARYCSLCVLQHVRIYIHTHIYTHIHIYVCVWCGALVLNARATALDAVAQQACGVPRGALLCWRLGVALADSCTYLCTYYVWVLRPQTHAHVCGRHRLGACLVGFGLWESCRGDPAGF